MYPMITSEEELDEIEKLIQEVKKGLDEKNIPHKNIRTGIMIETPAAVMISEELGKRVDFLSLGTNDLTQYTLAMDRQNLLLKNKYNDHHPALVKMIRMVTEAGHKSGCNVYICGELAADSNLTEKFIQMGVDGLSVVPAWRTSCTEGNPCGVCGRGKPTVREIVSSQIKILRISMFIFHIGFSGFFVYLQFVRFTAYS